LEDEKGMPGQVPEEEDSAARAARLAEKLRGHLKEELAEYGGGEAFLSWIRADGEENT
jgi:hypothetical protein